MKNKPQIIFIHGGDSFVTKEELYEFVRSMSYDPYAPEQKKWRDGIKESLLETHECFMPRMPNAWDADYTVWSIWFEKLLPYLSDGVVLVGHSLGGGFLLRYLSENNLPINISQLHLVAPAIDELDCPGTGEFSIDVASWTGFKSNIKEVHLWHSSDDEIVPIHHSERFLTKYPDAIFHRFSDKGHFLIESFTELEKAIVQ